MDGGAPPAEDAAADGETPPARKRPGPRPSACPWCGRTDCTEHCRCPGFSRCDHAPGAMCSRARYKRRLVCNSCEKSKLLERRAQGGRKGRAGRGRRKKRSPSAGRKGTSGPAAARAAASAAQEADSAARRAQGSAVSATFPATPLQPASPVSAAEAGAASEAGAEFDWAKSPLSMEQVMAILQAAQGGSQAVPSAAAAKAAAALAAALPGPTAQPPAPGPSTLGPDGSWYSYGGAGGDGQGAGRGATFVSARAPPQAPSAALAAAAEGTLAQPAALAVEPVFLSSAGRTASRESLRWSSSEGSLVTADLSREVGAQLGAAVAPQDDSDGDEARPGPSPPAQATRADSGVLAHALHEAGFSEDPESLAQQFLVQATRQAAGKGPSTGASNANAGVDAEGRRDEFGEPRPRTGSAGEAVPANPAPLLSLGAGGGGGGGGAGGGDGGRRHSGVGMSEEGGSTVDADIGEAWALNRHGSAGSGLASLGDIGEALDMIGGRDSAGAPGEGACGGSDDSVGHGGLADAAHEEGDLSDSGQHLDHGPRAALAHAGITNRGPSTLWGVASASSEGDSAEEGPRRGQRRGRTRPRRVSGGGNDAGTLPLGATTSARAVHIQTPRLLRPDLLHLNVEHNSTPFAVVPLNRSADSIAYVRQYVNSRLADAVDGRSLQFVAPDGSGIRTGQEGDLLAWDVSVPREYDHATLGTRLLRHHLFLRLGLAPAPDNPSKRQRTRGGGDGDGDGDGDDDRDRDRSSVHGRHGQSSVQQALAWDVFDPSHGHVFDEAGRNVLALACADVAAPAATAAEAAAAAAAAVALLHGGADPNAVTVEDSSAHYSPEESRGARRAFHVIAECPDLSVLAACVPRPDRLRLCGLPDVCCPDGAGRVAWQSGSVSPGARVVLRRLAGSVREVNFNFPARFRARGGPCPARARAAALDAFAQRVQRVAQRRARAGLDPGAALAGAALSGLRRRLALCPATAFLVEGTPLLRSQEGDVLLIGAALAGSGAIHVFEPVPFHVLPDLDTSPTMGAPVEGAPAGSDAVPPCLSRPSAGPARAASDTQLLAHSRIGHLDNIDLPDGARLLALRVRRRPPHAARGDDSAGEVNARARGRLSSAAQAQKQCSGSRTGAVTDTRTPAACVNPAIERTRIPSRQTQSQLPLRRCEHAMVAASSVVDARAMRATAVVYDVVGLAGDGGDNERAAARDPNGSDSTSTAAGPDRESRAIPDRCPTPSADPHRSPANDGDDPACGRERGESVLFVMRPPHNGACGPHANGSGALLVGEDLNMLHRAIKLRAAAGAHTMLWHWHDDDRESGGPGEVLLCGPNGQIILRDDHNGTLDREMGAVYDTQGIPWPPECPPSRPARLARPHRRRAHRQRLSRHRPGTARRPGLLPSLMRLVGWCKAS